MEAGFICQSGTYRGGPMTNPSRILFPIPCTPCYRISVNSISRFQNRHQSFHFTFRKKRKKKERNDTRFLRCKLNSLLSFLAKRLPWGSGAGRWVIRRSRSFGAYIKGYAGCCYVELCSERVQKFQYIKCSSFVPARRNEEGPGLRRMSVPRGGGAQQWQPLLMHINILASDATYFRSIQMTPSRKTNTCSATILRSSVTRSSPEPRGLFVKGRPEIIPFP